MSEFFIEVGNAREPGAIVEQMRQFADQFGGELARKVAEVPRSGPWLYQILTEWERLEWLFHHNGPSGYRFVTAESDFPRFGYEQVVRDH